MTSDPSGFTSAAERAYQEFRESRSGDLDAFCAARPELADELRRLHALFERVEGMLPGPLSARLAERYGSQADPLVSLLGDEDDEGTPTGVSGFSSDVLGRLGARNGAFGRYVLKGEIDRGGQGAVVRVWDEDLRRLLAMKVLLGKDTPESTGETPSVDPRSLGRFLEEAQVTGQLDHPGIVPVHELGLDADGRVYFTMKLVKGRTLKDVLELVAAGKDGWTQTRVLGVIAKVCEAMAYAHHKGVVHRDLKPANVMVGPFGEVYVMDWGLAKVLGREDTKNVAIAPQVTTEEIRSERHERAEASPDSPLLTMDGDVVGTPAYMPPEQALGRTHALGPHSDVYAAGAMLYHLFAGHMPYAEPGMRLSNYDLWHRVQEGPPASIAECAPRVPAELAAICERAMAREITHRYPDMSALAADISAYVERRVVSAYETGAWAEARKWVQRNRPLATSLAAAAVLLVGGLVASLLFKSRADANAKQAREQERIAMERADDVLSLSASKDLEDLIARAEELWPVHPELRPEYERWLEEARALIYGSSASPERGASSRPSLEEHTAKLAELRGRAISLTSAEAQAQQESHPRRGDLLSARAELQWYSRMLGLESWPAEEEFDATLAQQLLLDDAGILGELAWQLVDPQQPAFGEETAALKLARRALNCATDAERPNVRDTLAWALYRSGRFDDALREEQLALTEALQKDKPQYEASLAMLRKAIKSWVTSDASNGRRAQYDSLLDEVGELGRVVLGQWRWNFDAPEDRWWHIQLSKLVESLEELSDPRTGLMSDNAAAPFGWGIGRRLAFARSVGERTAMGPDAKRLWAEATRAIAMSPRYGGLEVSPQLGLLPIGFDHDSGLWEFAHIATGDLPERDTEGKLRVDGKTCIVLVLLPGGTFAMGAQSTDVSGGNFDRRASSDEGPVHSVSLAPFFISKYEMTQGQWASLTGANPSASGPDGAWKKTNNRWYRWPTYAHPVERVTWIDCALWLSRIGLELPTEAQWEYAARAGGASPWYTGEESDSLLEAANLGDAYGRTHVTTSWGWGGWEEHLDDGYAVHAPIGSLSANGFGLHNVHGNVYEWCRDAYGSYEQPVAHGDGERIVEGRDKLIRGAGWDGTASAARASARRRVDPATSFSSLGVRPARRLDR